MNIPICQTVREARSLVEEMRGRGETIVLVPTMGDLHAGHLSLVRAASRLGSVIVSVFVNPTQFSPGEDFEHYPRHLEADCAKLEEFSPALVFAPAPEEIYPEGEKARVRVHDLAEPLCGRHREGHFLGVTTVCTKLFLVLQPHIAVFGAKDAQQCLVMDRLVKDLLLPINLVFSPTIRETDGLAMSSRNRYLEGPQRDQATVLSRALAAGRSALESGERSAAVIEVTMAAVFVTEGIHQDYAEIRTVPELLHPGQVDGRVLLAAAAYVGRSRLIDNLCLEVDASSVQDSELMDEHCFEAVARRYGRA